MRQYSRSTGHFGLRWSLHYLHRVWIRCGGHGHFDRRRFRCLGASGAGALAACAISQQSLRRRLSPKDSGAHAPFRRPSRGSSCTCSCWVGGRGHERRIALPDRILDAANDREGSIGRLAKEKWDLAAERAMSHGRYCPQITLITYLLRFAPRSSSMLLLEEVFPFFLAFLVVAVLAAAADLRVVADWRCCGAAAALAARLAAVERANVDTRGVAAFLAFFMAWCAASFASQTLATSFSFSCEIAATVCCRFTKSTLQSSPFQMPTSKSTNLGILKPLSRLTMS